MRMNDMFNCLNEKRNQNPSAEHCLKLPILTKVFISRKVRMRIAFPRAVIFPNSIIIIVIITMMMMITVIKIIITT